MSVWGGAACFHRNREPFTCLPWGWGADVALRFPLGGQEEGQQSCHRRVPGVMSQRLCREVAGGGEWSWGSTSWPLCLPRMSPIANRGGLGHRHGGKGSGAEWESAARAAAEPLVWVWGRRSWESGPGRCRAQKSAQGGRGTAGGPAEGKTGAWPGLGGAVRRPSPHLGHPAQGTPLS